MRKCVECGDQLRSQKTWHIRSKPIKRAGYMDKYCHGPKKTPLPPTKPNGRPRAARHFRLWGEDAKTLCGLQAGRGGKYPWPRDGQFDVSFGRVTVKIPSVTCEHCLVTLIQRSKKALYDRLRALRKTPAQAFRESRSIQTVVGLKRLVNA